jgi:hypothetical protein
MLQLKRQPVLKWGPMGMQQISESHQGDFFILGFAGNSASNHSDYVHGLPHFLNRLYDII